jgi:hypothetical protein
MTPLDLHVQEPVLEASCRINLTPHFKCPSAAISESDFVMILPPPQVGTKLSGSSQTLKEAEFLQESGQDWHLVG